MREGLNEGMDIRKWGIDYKGIENSLKIQSFKIQSFKITTHENNPDSRWQNRRQVPD